MRIKIAVIARASICTNRLSVIAMKSAGLTKQSIQIRHSERSTLCEAKNPKREAFEVWIRVMLLRLNLWLDS